MDWQWAVLLGGLLLSAIFSGTETALFTLSRKDRLAIEQADGYSARQVVRLLNAPRRALNTLLLGNMIVNIAYSCVAAVLVMDLKRAGASAPTVLAASLVPLLALIFFGEVSPKMLAYSVARRWALLSAAPIALLERLFGPILWVMDTLLVRPLTRICLPPRRPRGEVTTEELTALMDLSARRGVVDGEAADMLREIVELTDLRADGVMVPRTAMIACDIDAGRQAVEDTFRRTHLRKIPIYRGDLDNILGILHAKRFFSSPDASIETLLRPVFFLPEAANLEQVLRQFRRQRHQMAVVVDEYGGTAGLITLEDVLEEIVGEIDGPYEEHGPPDIQKRSEREYILAGRVPLREWRGVFTLDDVPARVSTIGGFVTHALGRGARVGDIVRQRNLKFTVLSMAGRAVQFVRVELSEPEGGAA